MGALKKVHGAESPPWQVSAWLNVREPLSLESLRGRVVVLEVFQLLCPGCVSHGLPQAKRIAETFPDRDVQVVGLHSVFEHHEAMGPTVLQAFLHEYRIEFPVGIDAHSPGESRPQTMAEYGMRGTPTLLIYDRAGKLAHHHFGQVSDMAVGAEIARLIDEPAPGQAGAACTEDACEA